MEKTVTVKDLKNLGDEYEVWDEETHRWTSIHKSCYMEKRDGAFPEPELAANVINLLTCYDSLSKKYTVFGLKNYLPKDKNVKYHHCKSEEDLLKKFIGHFSSDYPDCLVGWNSAGFDIPYLVNRITFQLGKEWADELSPIGRIYEKVNATGKFGMPSKEYVIEGISCIDYMVLYKKFNLNQQESYKLDYIGEVELDDHKISYEGSLWDLSVNDWETYVDYNIQDVKLVVDLDEELKYLDLLRFIAYLGLCNLENAVNTLPVINGAVAIRARHRDEKIPTFIRPHTHEKIPGGYVAKPKLGFSQNVVSFDANSLYPSVMISLNMSPETKLGSLEKIGDVWQVKHVSGKTFDLTKDKFVAFLKEEKAAMSKSNVLFSQKKMGIMPEFLDFLYTKRKEMKGKMFKAKRALDDTKLSKKEVSDLKTQIKKFDTFQNAYKITLNSTYGYCANKYAPLGDDEIGSSVTLTGQAVIKKSNELFENFVTQYYPELSGKCDNALIYNDTDSIVPDTIIKTLAGDKTIEQIWNESIYVGNLTEHGHEYIDTDNLSVSTYEKNTKSHTYKPVKRIFRHKVSKRKFKIKTSMGYVIITEDHGLMVYRNGELIRISPKDVLSGDKLIMTTEKNVSL